MCKKITFTSNFAAIKIDLNVNNTIIKNKEMRRTGLLIAVGLIGLSSCVSQKKYAALETEKADFEKDLSAARMELASCLDKNKGTNDQVEYLKSVNYKLLESVGSLSTLSKKEAENLEKSLESLNEKERQIKNMRDALNRKDSVTLALVTSLKGELGMMDDEDVQIVVEKGVVYISLSDKLLFKSGNAELSSEAKNVLGKVAKVINNKPDMDVMVEGHTDNKAFKDGTAIKDNWELSVMRGAAVVRVLEQDFNVDPARLVAAGRSYYVPVASNDNKEGRALNRRTKIIILPKLDQFYGMIEEGLENAE